MLVLSRRMGEKVLFPGIRAFAQVLSVKNGTVRLGFEVPPYVRIIRAELREGADLERGVDTGASSPARV